MTGTPQEQGCSNALWFLENDAQTQMSGACHVMTDSFSQVLSAECSDCSGLEHGGNWKPLKKRVQK